MSSWYYLVGENQHGPVDEPTLRALFETDQLPPETFVWKEGMEGWVTAVQVPELIAPAAATIPFVQPTSDATAAAALQTHPLITEPGSPATLIQKKRFKGSQTLELLPGRLQITTKDRRTRKLVVREVSLTQVDSTPARVRKQHIPSLVLAVPMVLLAVACLFGSIFALFDPKLESQTILPLVGTNAFLILFAALLAGIAYARATNATVFRVTNGPSIEIWQDVPNPAEFENFVSLLQQAMHHAVNTTVPEPERPKVCANCNSPDILPGFPAPLCEPCRTRLTRFSIPLWLKAVAVLLAIVLLVSSVRIPRELGAAVAIQRGNEAEVKGDHGKAVTFYERVLATYPKSREALRDAALSSLHAGNKEAALGYANKLFGKNGEIQKEDLELLNQIKGANP